MLVFDYPDTPRGRSVGCLIGLHFWTRLSVVSEESDLRGRVPAERQCILCGRVQRWMVAKVVFTDAPPEGSNFEYR